MYLKINNNDRLFMFTQYTIYHSLQFSNRKIKFQ